MCYGHVILQSLRPAPFPPLSRLFVGQLMWLTLVLCALAYEIGGQGGDRGSLTLS